MHVESEPQRKALRIFYSAGLFVLCACVALTRQTRYNPIKEVRQMADINLNDVIQHNEFIFALCMFLDEFKRSTYYVDAGCQKFNKTMR